MAACVSLREASQGALRSQCGSPVSARRLPHSAPGMGTERCDWPRAGDRRVLRCSCDLIARILRKVLVKVARQDRFHRNTALASGSIPTSAVDESLLLLGGSASSSLPHATLSSDVHQCGVSRPCATHHLGVSNVLRTCSWLCHHQAMGDVLVRWSLSSSGFWNM